MDETQSEVTFDEKLSLGTRLRHGWNAFKNKDPAKKLQDEYRVDEGSYPVTSYSGYYPDRHRLSMGVDRTIVASIYNRIATDVTAATIKHVRVDKNDTYRETLLSGLGDCLTRSANIDQSGSSFMMDLVISMLDEGVVAAVPVDTTINPNIANSFDIQSIRTGKIQHWRTDCVDVEVYNERRGQRQTIRMAKSAVAIIENPFYTVMNEPNSTLKRLVHKLKLLDEIDEDAASGKLDLIIQLPYTVKNETKKKQAEQRRESIEQQLTGSKYGIAYTDATERITQLNRPVENQLMSQIEYLTSMLYSQLGLTQEIMNGSASEEVMLNYYKRTIDVILTAICDEFERKFLTKTAYTQGQRLKFYRDPFSLTPTTAIADIADKFTRNEILSPNELRGVVGFMPVEDPQADELRNRNLSQPAEMDQGSAMAGDEEGGFEESGSYDPLQEAFNTPLSELS